MDYLLIHMKVSHSGAAAAAMTEQNLALVQEDSGEQFEQVHCEGCIQDPAAPLTSPCLDTLDDVYGDAQVRPRIGPQYQVNIPSLMKDLYCGELSEEGNNMPDKLNGDCSINFGLPIPVMWISNVDHIKCEPIKFRVHPARLDGVESVGFKAPSTNFMNSSKEMVDDRMEADFHLAPQLNKLETDANLEVHDIYPVPGLLGEPWTDFEQECFLLGLYIFGKNLVQVKRFIETKGMGDTLSFYYGKFYRSRKYHKWSESRKIRSRRSIHGQRLFIGWRQQELLSRLLPHVSEEQGNALLEVSNSFSEGKIPLEEYVKTLKMIAGLDLLVEAVGVGRGNNDLTGITMEPSKINQFIVSRPGIPVGKACSTLSSADIIKFLTGDFRLSKARSNDLFWEAVWPRLLERGWHSEQPKNKGYFNSKNSLVFLVPGIKKFSRRKLVKGDHYFDSVSDVLNTVASNPRLLDLEVEAINGIRGAKEECRGHPALKVDQMGSSQQHCYLRPRASNSNQELLKFTVVDTSMHHGEDPFKVRELRSLPVDNSSMKIPSSRSRESDSSTSEDQVDEPHSSDYLKLYRTVSAGTKQESNIKSTSDMANPCGTLDDVLGLHKQISVGGSGLTNTLDESTEKGSNCQFLCGVKSDRPNYLIPVTKRRRLNSCTKSVRIHSKTDALTEVSVLKRNEIYSGRDFCERNDVKVAEEDVPLHNISMSSSGRALVDQSSACGPSETELSLSQEKPLVRNLIDLNLPHVPPDFESAGFFSDGIDSIDGSNPKEGYVPSETSCQPRESSAVGITNIVASEEQPVTNARRQSTRNRPLTTRALEALECGFLNTKKRGRGTKVLPDENLVARSSRRRVHGAIETSTAGSKNSANASTCFVDLKVEGMDEECSSNVNTDLRKSQLQGERKEDHDLLDLLKHAFQPQILTGNDIISG